MSTYVVFFGGYQATLQDVTAWRDSAKAQKSDLTVDAYPYPPGASAGGESAVSTFSNAKTGKFKSVIADIQASTADKIYIVGHSSGCAIANAVDAGLKDHSNIVLVALDGYLPGRKQLARQSTQVWSAECGEAKSLHYKDLKEAVGGRLQVYPATDCKNKWALHFSLVNSAINDQVVKSNKDISKGYSQCKANLAWLS